MFRVRPKARALPLARRAALVCTRCSESSRSSSEPRASKLGIDALLFTDGELVSICHKIKDGRFTPVVFSAADAWGKVVKLRAIADV
jgi:hypothetical protein